MKKPKAILKLILAAASLILSACVPLARPSELAILDPVFIELYPSLAKALRQEAYEVFVLPPDASSRSLFDTLERLAPERLIVSPLLAQEIPAIAENRPTLAIGVLAYEGQIVNGAARVLRFYSEDAALVAAEAALRELNSMDTARQKAGLAAIFAGANAIARADAFKSVFQGGNASKMPIVEVISADWSPEAAERLRSLDGALIYVSVPAQELGRWLRELSSLEGRSPAPFIIAESQQVPLEPWQNCDAIVYWHMEGSIKSLAGLLRLPQTGAIDVAGAWHYKKLR